MEESGELDYLINQEVNIQTTGPDGAHIVSPDEDLTDDGAMESPNQKLGRGMESRNGRSRERHVTETTKTMRRHSADAPIKRRSSFGSDHLGGQHQFRGRSASPYQGRSSSVPRKATFVDGEYIPGSTSLFRPTQSRVSSMQAVYDRRQEIEKLRNPPQSTRMDDTYTPSDRLLRTTSSRVMAQQAWVEHQKELEQKKQLPPVKIDETYKPSDRLLKPTKTYQVAIQSWEKEKEDRRLADDIWWEKRKSSEPYKSKIVATSKLTEPTKASLASRRTKAPPKANGVDPDHPSTSHTNHSPVKSDAHSPAKTVLSPHLLKPTQASMQGTWKIAHEKELHPEEPPKPVLNLATKNSHIHAKSKLYEETWAAKHKKKIFESELELARTGGRASSPSRGPVKEISAHLLANPRARSKSPPVKKDPREQNWNSFATLSAAKSSLNNPLEQNPRTVSPLQPRRESLDSTHQQQGGTSVSSSSLVSPKIRPDTLHRLATPKHINSPPPSTPGLHSSASFIFGNTSRLSSTPSFHVATHSPTATAVSQQAKTSSARKSTGSKIPGPSPQKTKHVTHNHHNHHHNKGLVTPTAQNSHPSVTTSSDRHHHRTDTTDNNNNDNNTNNEQERRVFNFAESLAALESNDETVSSKPTPEEEEEEEHEEEDTVSVHEIHLDTDLVNESEHSNSNSNSNNNNDNDNIDNNNNDIDNDNHIDDNSNDNQAVDVSVEQQREEGTTTSAAVEAQ